MLADFLSANNFPTSLFPSAGTEKCSTLIGKANLAPLPLKFTFLWYTFCYQVCLRPKGCAINYFLSYLEKLAVPTPPMTHHTP